MRKGQRTKDKGQRILRGFSLVEMLVVMVVFSILAVVASQVLITTLKSSKKSESVVVVKQNVDNAISTMERLLRNAQDISSCSGNQLIYVDEYYQPASFRCISVGPCSSHSGDCYIASGSANIRLTSTEVRVICGSVFQCPVPAPNVAESVIITLRAVHDELGTGPDGAQVSATSKILLRTF